MRAAPTPARQRTVAAACAGLALLMVGASYAAVPLYDLLCRVTGLNGTTRVASAGPVERGRAITVRFDANVAPGLPWGFRAEVPQVELALGETREVAFTARNLAARVTAGTATFNVTPAVAGKYFNKITCFCFTEQSLKPGEGREEAVVFFVDPAIARDPDAAGVDVITLSYTFFPAKPANRPVAALAGPPKP